MDGKAFGESGTDGKAGNAGTINGGPGNDTITVSGGRGGSGAKGEDRGAEGGLRGGNGGAGATGNTGTINGGVGRDKITVTGGAGGHGGQGAIPRRGMTSTRAITPSGGGTEATVAPAVPETPAASSAPVKTTP